MNIEILLPASKSISNRVLIIRALAGSNEVISNLSEARDTLDLKCCLQSEEKEIHVGEGATTLRFLLAYFAVSRKNKILYCGPSLQKRPIKVLLEILEQLGCKFRFLEHDYQLPLEILQGVQENYSENIFIDTNLSSQFISAILLIAPYLKNGLEINYSNDKVSEPYIQMTKKLMLEFGAKLQEKDHIIQIKASEYIAKPYFVEADWSAVSFFYAFLGILNQGSYFFSHLKMSGLQGDEILVSFFKQFGIVTTTEPNGIKIYKEEIVQPDYVEFDFSNYPDLFPPITLFCAITKTNARFTGLQNLVYKESNRLKIITDFLLQQNVRISQHITERGNLSTDFDMSIFNSDIPDTSESHNDHRIAMSFSLLNTIRKIKIHNPEVVQKSFPGYWSEIEKLF